MLAGLCSIGSSGRHRPTGRRRNHVAGKRKCTEGRIEGGGSRTPTTLFPRRHRQPAGNPRNRVSDKTRDPARSSSGPACHRHGRASDSHAHQRSRMPPTGSSASSSTCSPCAHPISRRITRRFRRARTRSASIWSLGRSSISTTGSTVRPLRARRSARRPCPPCTGPAEVLQAARRP